MNFDSIQVRVKIVVSAGGMRLRLWWVGVAADTVFMVKHKLYVWWLLVLVIAVVFVIGGMMWLGVLKVLLSGSDLIFCKSELEIN